jgi:hypothetical protein
MDGCDSDTSAEPRRRRRPWAAFLVIAVFSAVGLIWFTSARVYRVEYCTECGIAYWKTSWALHIPGTSVILFEYPLPSERNDDGGLTGVLDPNAMCHHRWKTYHVQIIDRVGLQPEGHAAPYSMYSYRTALDGAFAAYVRARPELTEQMRALLRKRDFIQMRDLLIRAYEQYEAETSPSP